MNFKNRSRIISRAFTLIELLVVVAIIGLLISILLPALEKARASGRKTVCLTNMRTLGQAVEFYRADNREWGIRGIAGFTTGPEYHVFWTAHLRYLSPNPPGQFRSGNTTVDLKNANYDRLWFGQSSLGRRIMHEIFSSTKSYNCPDHPEVTHGLDYVASAFPIKYTQASVDLDVAGGGDAGDQYQGVGGATALTYHAEYKMKEFGEAQVNPSQIILVTEGHRSLPATLPPPGPVAMLPEYRFHHFFLTSQLPFGAFPRIANDERHPGGLNALFFDGSARTMGLKTMDVGWPNNLGMRLKHFAVPPDNYY
ncbi:MAG: prepilin-type N-terminal cleavage/methylation domain-containing protein [Planctomycetes bacterium]|nr:prepilin-type N-terminal cleavage/methylation domain-containing protein [Planctomycetota bacterium]